MMRTSKTTRTAVKTRTHHRRNERGNILFMVLMAVALIGLLSAAVMRGNDSDNANIDDEQLAMKASEVQRYAGELERAVRYIMQDGKSESDIRFAHPDAPSDYGDLSADSDKSDQVFHVDGGGAEYRLPPSVILATADQNWEFYGGTAIPQAGSTAPELVAVIPDVSQQFCQKINALNGNTSEQPEDTGSNSTTSSNAGSCIYGGSTARFDDGEQYYDAAGHTHNTMDESTFDKLPALQGCVLCSTDSKYHFYHVLMVR